MAGGVWVAVGGSVVVAVAVGIGGSVAMAARARGGDVETAVSASLVNWQAVSSEISIKLSDK